MITDPITLGVTGHVNVFALREVGPGARSIRPTTSASITGTNFEFRDMQLTISHEITKANRRRSLLRLDFQAIQNTVLGEPSKIPSPSVSLVVDQPKAGNVDYDMAVKELLSRVLGFITQNATSAPDHTFASATQVAEFLRGEP